MPKVSKNISKGVEKPLEDSEVPPCATKPTTSKFIMPESGEEMADFLSDIEINSSDDENPTDDEWVDNAISEQDDESDEEIEETDANRGSHLGNRARSCSPGRRASRSSSGDRSSRNAYDSQWTEDPSPPPVHAFTAIPGLKVRVPDTPLKFFQLFFTRTLLNFILRETNHYAHLRQPGGYQFSTSDIAKFIGIRLRMGLIKKPAEYDYWSRGFFEEERIPNVMSRDKYMRISRSLHFFNRKAIPKDNQDRLILIRPILEYFQSKCRDLYTPSCNLSLDEGMIPYKGRLQMKVYCPLKPNKYGLKIYYLCEAESGYVCNFIMYQGITSTLRDTVFNLLDRHLNLGYRVWMDNYYNSVSIAEELYANGTHTCGTLRLNRGAPTVLRDLAKKKMPRDKTVFRKKGETSIICWQDTRLVSMITNLHGPETEAYVHKKRVKKDGKYGYEQITLERPIAIRDYVKYMQGVDRLDQLLHYYGFERRSAKWTKKVFFYFIEEMITNAYILYKKCWTGKKITSKHFHMIIADALMDFEDKDWPINLGDVMTHAPDLADHAPYSFPTKKSASGGPSTSTASGVPPTTTASGVPPTTTASGVPPTTTASGGTATSASGVRPHDSDSEEDADNPEDVRPSKSRKYPDSLFRLRAKGEKGLKHQLTHIGRKRRKCRVCSRNGVRKDTYWVCEACGDVPLCAKSDCYKLYHSMAKYWTSPDPPRKRRRIN